MAGQAQPGAFEADPQVDAIVAFSRDAGSEPLVQLCRDGLKEGSAQDRQVDDLRCRKHCQRRG